MLVFQPGKYVVVVRRLINKLRDQIFRYFDLNFSTVRHYQLRKRFQKSIERIGNDRISLKYEGHDILMRTNTSDQDVFYQVIIEKEYDFLVELVESFGKRKTNLTLVDLGANIGITSIYLSNKLPINQIYAVEADPSNFKLLQENTSNLEVNVETINMAIWGKDERLGFIDFRDGQAWSKRVGYVPEINEVVQGTTLESLIQRFGVSSIDILKIDIEGSEAELLHSEESFREALSRTKFLAIEIHDETTSRIEMSDLISGSGFRTYSKGETLFGYKIG